MAIPIINGTNVQRAISELTTLTVPNAVVQSGTTSAGSVSRFDVVPNYRGYRASRIQSDLGGAIGLNLAIMIGAGSIDGGTNIVNAGRIAIQTGATLVSNWASTPVTQIVFSVCGIGESVDTEKAKILEDGSLLSKFASGASDPTSSNIPSGSCRVWKNTTTGVLSLWANDGGTLKKVALS